MRYNVAVFERFKSVYKYAPDIAAAAGQGMLNRAVYTGGMLYNGARWELAKGKGKSYSPELLPPTDSTFAEMTLLANGLDLAFRFTPIAASDPEIFAPPPIVAFKRKKITTTTVVDRKGDCEIIESFGLENWTIEIKGLLVDVEDHQYPAEKVRQLRRLFDIDGPVEISSPLFDDLGISAIWLSDQSLDPVEGYPDTVRFAFSARSIRPVDFDLITGKSI